MLQPYGRLARIDRPIGIWLLLLPGWWAIALAAGGFLRMNSADWFVFVLFLPGAVIMRAAGCVINDLWDQNLDRQVTRTRDRPLAAGEITRLQALIFLLILSVLGLLILLQLNIMAVLLGVLVLPLIVIYPLMKRLTWWPQAFLGLTFNFSVLIGWTAITGSPDAPALLLYLGCLLWTLGYDTVYAHQDKEDDALTGIKSSAIRLGPHSKRAILAFYSLHWALLISSYVLAEEPFWQVALLLLPGLHLIWQMRVWETENPASSLAVFKSNAVYGSVVLLISLL